MKNTKTKQELEMYKLGYQHGFDPTALYIHENILSNQGYSDKLINIYYAGCSDGNDAYFEYCLTEDTRDDG